MRCSGNGDESTQGVVLIGSVGAREFNIFVGSRLEPLFMVGTSFIVRIFLGLACIARRTLLRNRNLTSICS